MTYYVEQHAQRAFDGQFRVSRRKLNFAYYNSDVAYAVGRCLDHPHIAFSFLASALAYAKALSENYSGIRVVEETKTVTNCARGVICTKTCFRVVKEFN